MRVLAGLFAIMTVLSTPTLTSAQWGAADPMYLTAGTSGFRRHDLGTVGVRFTVKDVDLTVRSLGYIDENLDGLAISHQVGLWNSAGSLIASVTVGGTGPQANPGTLIGDFRYVDLTQPVVLTLGQTYTLGGQSTSSNHGPSGTADRFRESSTDASVLSHFGSLGSVYTTVGSNGFSRPTDGLDTNKRGYIAANMIVPEPTLLAPLTLAGLSLLARRRRAA